MREEKEERSVEEEARRNHEAGEHLTGWRERRERERGREKERERERERAREERERGRGRERERQEEGRESGPASDVLRWRWKLGESATISSVLRRTGFFSGSTRPASSSEDVFAIFSDSASKDYERI